MFGAEGGKHLVMGEDHNAAHILWIADPYHIFQPFHLFFIEMAVGCKRGKKFKDGFPDRVIARVQSQDPPMIVFEAKIAGPLPCVNTFLIAGSKGWQETFKKSIP